MDYLYQLSTSKEIAAIGYAEYKALLKQCSASARQLFLGAAPIKPHYTKFLDVRRCFAGISAEIVFEQEILDAFPKEAFTDVEHLINTQAQHFFFYHKERTSQYNWETYHLFNLPAVRQVAKNYPAYFPAEILLTTREWVEQHWTTWADGKGVNCVRYGLLSGFPLEAALKFSLDKDAKEKILARSEKTNLSYCAANPEKDKAYIRQLDEIYSSLAWEALTF